MLDDTTTTPEAAREGAADAGPALPPVRHWPALDLSGVDFDPVLARLMDEGRSPASSCRTGPAGPGW